MRIYVFKVAVAVTEPDDHERENTQSDIEHAIEEGLGSVLYEPNACKIALKRVQDVEETSWRSTAEKNIDSVLARRVKLTALVRTSTT
jgi:hypothetical protein